MAVKKLNFTAKELNNTPLSTSSIPTKLKDEGGTQSERFLYLYAGKTKKTFYFVRKINGTPVRFSLGHFPATTIEQARKRCRAKASISDEGINPMVEKKAARQQGLTLADAFEQYIEQAKARIDKPLQLSTESNYRRSMAKHFSKWMTKPAENITHDMVAKWHKQASSISGSSANNALRAGRAVLNHQKTISERQQTEHFRFNPFQGHKLTKETPKSVCIDTEDLPKWFAAVEQLSSETMRDYLTLILYTGLRRREAARLEWADVDLPARTLTARKTKNGNDHTLPLSVFLIDFLLRRKKNLPEGTRFVFPSHGKAGYISEPKKSIQRIAELTGLHCPPHGLRRTFANFAAFEAGVHELARKRLLNHSIGADVTEKHYSVLSMPRLRRYQQEVSDSIQKASTQAKPLADVVDIGVVKW